MFYVLLVAILATALLGLLSVARLVDSAAAGGGTALHRAQGIAVSLALALLVVAAALSSPLG